MAWRRDAPKVSLTDRAKGHPARTVPIIGCPVKGNLMSKFANVSTALALVFGACSLSVVAHADPATGGQAIDFTGEDSGSFQLSRQLGLGAPIGTATTAGDVELAAALIGEDSGSWHLSQVGTPAMRTRAEVAQEVAQARASGELGALVGEDSGSARVSTSMPAHWARYVGPNIGNEFSLAPQLERHVA